MVVQAVALGFAANAIDPHGLAWVRVPLRQTHKAAVSREVVATQSSATPSPRLNPGSLPEKSVVAPAPPAPTKPAVESQADKPVQPPRPKPKPEDERIAPPAAKHAKAEALFTSLEDAKILFDRKSAVFVDARHKEDYDLEHIPGALSLFVNGVDTLYSSVLGKVPKDQTIITYCSDPQCETAIKLADALVDRGHTRVFILLEGLPSWRDAGYPTEKGAGQ